MLLSGNFYLYLQNGYSQNITRHPVYDFRTNWVFYATSRFNQIWLVRKIPLNENDIYVITTVGDRFDLLAQQYYGDSSLWWVISIANEELKQNSLVPPPGGQIRIPYNPTEVVNEFNRINS